ncbi:MAG: type II secretion system protein GspD [Planctomycetota bacterium]|jgi:protein transport protein HofQ
MKKPKYTKKILLCIILTICVGYGPTQSQPTLDAQKITQEVGRENPFAKIPRAVKTVTPIALQSSEFVEESPELFVQTIMLKFLDAQSLRQAIGNLSSGHGTIVVNETNNSLIICDTKEQLEKIVSEIKKADKTPRQIMVEMVIVDVQLNDDTAIGINWDLLTDTVQDMTYRQNFTTRLGTTVEDATTIGNATSFNTTGLGSNLSIINGDIRNVISVLQEKKEVEILASPRVMVVSGKTASIKSVRELSYNAITDTSAGGSMSSTEFKEVGVTMDVTATLTDDDLISLNVRSEQSVAVGTSLTEVPIIDTRNASSEVLLQDGQVVIIGGLRRQELTKDINQVPILGDIPIIGLLFRYTQTVVNNTELVIFLSPHIYNDEEPIPEDAMEKFREIKDKPMPSIKKIGDDKK